MEKVFFWNWRVWVLFAFIFLLVVIYMGHPAVTLSRDVSVPLRTATIDKDDKMTILPWWEANDCQCDSQECGNPSVTFQSMFKNEVGGACGFRAWAAGDGQRVISFSLFGNDSDYWNGLGKILPEVEKLYPGWKVRVYTDPRGHAAALCPLLHRHSSLLFVCDITNLPSPLGNLSGVHPMIWRVAPLGDPQVDAMMVRDSDSQLSERELAAVNEWLASGKTFHVMRDHPYHNIAVMGGMWGATWSRDPVKARRMRTLRARIISQTVGKTGYGEDQIALQNVLWPVMRGRVVAHDSYNCRVFKGSSPWPTQRSNGIFVGAARLREKYKDSTISQPCPMACRPPAHRDWLYC